MKKSNRNILTIEAVIVVLMSLAAGYALLDGLFFIPFIGLLIIGVVTVIILRNLSFIFSITAGLICLPAFMKLNNVKWWLFSPERLNFCPDLSLPLALAIGLIIICGGLMFSYLQPLRRELRILQDGLTEEKQTGQYVRNQNMAAAGAVLVCGAASAVIVFILELVRNGLAGWFRNLPWVLPAVGLVSLIVLGLVIFWLVGSRHGTGTAGTDKSGTA
jgi:hypothetical protein